MLCQASALSLYGELAEARMAIDFIPGFRNRSLRFADLHAAHGVTKRTPSKPPGTPRQLKSHTSWWIPLGVVPMDLFLDVSDE